MSGNAEDEKEAQKAMPLDLARSQITTVRAVDGKTPLVMTNQSLRGMRVLTQAVASSSNPSSVSGQTIITTNIVPQAVLKSDANNRTQIANIISSTQAQSAATNITIQRPAQITLSTPLVASVPGTSYHVPRGAAVVANLAAPRSNVAAARAPMVVTAQGAQAHAFVRPPRTPSPAQNTAWLTTNSSNGAQIKGAPTVLSSPVRGATVTGKPQLVSRTQTATQSVSTIRPGTILQNAITIGQSGQLHSFKSGATGIQALGNAVTIAQVLPTRTQAVVYSANTAGQFSPATRITVASTIPNQRPTLGRPLGQVTTARLAVPVNVSQSGARLVAPQATVLTSGARISVSTPQPTVLGTSARIVTSQPSVTIGRLSVGPAAPTVSTTNILGQTRISTLNLASLVMTNTTQPRTIAQGAKVITQQTPTIHLTTLPTSIKTQTTQSSVVTTVSAPRTIVNIPAATIVTQRPATVMPSQAISIAKAFPQGENVVAASATGVTVPPSVLIQTPTTTARRSSPNIVNQPMRFSSVMVVEPKQFATNTNTGEDQQLNMPKINSSPRPSILRKRDHEGSPLKAAKNLTSALGNLAQQPQQQQNVAPVSPPIRPDSRGNGHSSGGSTTISATSSPGLAEVNEDSMPHVPMNNKEEEIEPKPVMEMSPRKKPRKQQLTGNDLDGHNDDMQFISESCLKKEEESDGNQSDEPRDGAPEAGQVTTVRKPATASLLNSYRQTWKATHNHYLRYSDVRPKDERRPTIMDLANQCRVQEKVNGWKIHHLSTQMEDLAEQEHSVYNQLTELLKCTETHDSSKFEDINRINELIKGNLQRIKIINDGMIEAKTQIMKIFDHKVHVTDIINRCASKRNFKKREKS